MQLQSLPLAAIALAAVVAGHPGPHPEPSYGELARRSELAKRCGPQAGLLNEARRKRAAEKRSIVPIVERDTNVTIHTEGPTYSTLQNDTCVLTPDVTAGPYVWPRSQTLRQDMTEDQVGVPLYLDIGVMNVNTCEPLENALVDLWHCNATGYYSSFEGDDPNTNFTDLLAEKNLTLGSGTLDLHTGATTWLRGMWPTDANGMMEMKTVFPGFYAQRTVHIHAEVHTDWVVRGNGTLVTSNTIGTGQLFFAEDLTEQIMALEPYASHTEIPRTLNDVDSVYTMAVGSWNPLMSVEALDGEDVTKGMVAYITIGVEA